MSMIAPKKEVLDLIVTRYQTDIHDYLADQSHPLHTTASAVHTMAVMILQCEERLKNLWSKIHTYRGDTEILHSHIRDIDSHQCRYEAYLEMLSLAMIPFLPTGKESHR